MDDDCDNDTEKTNYISTSTKKQDESIEASKDVCTRNSSNAEENSLELILTVSDEDNLEDCDNLGDSKAKDKNKKIKGVPKTHSKNFTQETVVKPTSAQNVVGVEDSELRESSSSGNADITLRKDKEMENLSSLHDSLKTTALQIKSPTVAPSKLSDKSSNTVTNKEKSEAIKSSPSSKAWHEVEFTLNDSPQSPTNPIGNY